MNWSRFLLAFMVAPAAPAVLFVIPSLFFGGSGALFVLVATCFVTYAHALVLGLPIAVLLVRRRGIALWQVLCAAFLIGALPFGLFTLYQETTIGPGAGYTSNGVVLREDGNLTSAGLAAAAFGVLQCGLLGAATGFVWWLIARPKRAHTPHGA